MPILTLTSADAGLTVPVSGSAPWTVYGTDAADTIEIAAGTQATVTGGSGTDVIHFLGGSADYTVALVGTNAVFTHTATGKAITVPLTATGDSVSFGNGTAVLLSGSTAANVMLGTQNITAVSAAVTGATGTATGTTTPGVGQTFTLTTAATDVKTLTTGNDTVDGSTLDTLNTGDIIADASTTDSDVLNATISAGITPTVSNVETLNITDKFGGNTFTASGVSGGKIIIGSTYGFSETIDAVNGTNITSVQGGDTITTLSVSTISNNAVINQNKATTITLDGKTADADAVTINLSGTALTIANGADDIKTLNLKTAGTASTVTLITSVLADTAASIAVTGDKDVTIKAAAVDLENAATGLGAGISKTMTNGAKLHVNLTTVGASVDLTKVAADDYVISSAVAMAASNITFAAGTQTVSLTKNVITGTGALIATGSATTDVLNLSETVANTNLVTTGFETVNFTNNTGAALSFTSMTLGTDANLVLNSAFNATIATTGVAGFKSVSAAGLTGTSALSLTTGTMTTNASVTGTANADLVDFGTGSAIGKYTITTDAGNDTITGGTGNDTIDAGAGNDVIATGNGDNFVIAGDGNDAVTLGTGADTVILGAGDDAVSVIASNWTTGDIIQGGDGTDTLTLTGAVGATISVTSQMIGIEKIVHDTATTTAFSTTFSDAVVAAGATFTYDASLVNTTANTFDASAELDGTLVVKFGSTGVINQIIKTGALADTITATAAAASTYAITAGKGADTITLDLAANSGIDIITQAKGDSGTLTAVTSGMSVATMDVITNFNETDADTLVTGNASILVGNFTRVTTGVAPVTLANDSAYLIQGSYNSTTKTFALNTAGADSFLVYDNDNTAAIQFEGIVLIGTTGDGGSAFATGTFTI